MEQRPNDDATQMRSILALSIVFFIVTVTLSVFMEELLFFSTIATPLFVFWVLLITWSMMLSIRYLERRALVLGLACLAIPFVLTWATLYAFVVGDIIHFAVMRPYYDREVARLPKNGARYEEFNWGGMLFASRGVVYDETDQIGLPRGRQSRAWISRMKNTDLMCGETTLIAPVRPLGGHYYLTSFGC